MKMSLVWMFFILLVAEEGLNCPDRSALNKVDVWVHVQSNDLGQHYKSININELDGTRMIDVTYANVSVLCDGMVKMFPLLEQLTLIHVNLTEILPEAFQRLPKLTLLSLAVNNLTKIRRHYFKNLHALKYLYLSSNKIEEIDSDSFNDLVNLQKIFLDRNNIYEIDSQWFVQTPKISVIDISFNKISKLQSKAFTLAPNGMVEIRLQHNLVEVVEPKAVTTSASEEEEPYLILHLDKNNIRAIDAEFVESMDDLHSNLVFNSNYLDCVPPEVLRLLKTTSVSLHIVQNPLSCECMETIQNFVNDHELRATFYYNTTLECELPGFRPPNWF